VIYYYICVSGDIPEGQYCIRISTDPDQTDTVMYLPLVHVISGYYIQIKIAKETP
jgi:hypothetical protein